jgi:hypothetical protein
MRTGAIRDSEGGEGEIGPYVLKYTIVSYKSKDGFGNNLNLADKVYLK